MFYEFKMVQSSNPTEQGACKMLRKTPPLFKQKVMYHLASCSELLAWLLGVTQRECKTRALSHHTLSTSSPSAGDHDLTKDWLCCLILEVAKGSRTKQYRHMEILRPGDTSFTREVPQLLVWPCNQDHLVACCSPSSSSTGDEVCLKTHTLPLWSQKGYFNTPTHLLQKQNWAEIFLWHLFSPFFSTKANEEFHVHIIVMHSSLISLCVFMV